MAPMSAGSIGRIACSRGSSSASRSVSQMAETLACLANAMIAIFSDVVGLDEEAFEVDCTCRTVDVGRLAGREWLLGACFLAVSFSALRRFEALRAWMVGLSADRSALAYGLCGRMAGGFGAGTLVLVVLTGVTFDVSIGSDENRFWSVGN